MKTTFSKRRLALISALVATAVSAPALAFAFGGSGAGGQSPMGNQGFGGHHGQRAALTQEAIKAATVTLDQAITKAKDSVSGTVAMARLSPFTPRGLQGDTNAFAAPQLQPTYMVMLVDEDTRTMVTVDAATGEAAVAGSASGIMAMGPGRDMDDRGGRRGHGGQGGPGRGAPADMSKAKVSAEDAVTKALAEVPDGTATMVRGAQRGDDTAWMVGVQSAAQNTAPSIVFVDPTSGDILRVEQLAQRGPGMGPNQGMGPGGMNGQGPGMGQGQGQGMGPGMGGMNGQGFQAPATNQ